MSPIDPESDPEFDPESDVEFDPESEPELDPEANAETEQDSWEKLAPALVRLDSLLERAIAAVQGSAGATSADEPPRGMYIGSAEIDRLMARPPGEPAFGQPGRMDDDQEIWRGTRLDWLAEVFNLSPFELNVVLIALAPHVDLKYERIYAYLQNDVNPRRPSVDLVLTCCVPPAPRSWPSTRFLGPNRRYFGMESFALRQNRISLIPRYWR